MPERHKKFVRMLRVRVCLPQFAYDRLVKPAALQLQLPVRKEVLLWFSVWTDMWTLGVLRKQESEGEEAPWLAGLAGRETPPSQERERRSASDYRVPGHKHCSTYSGGGRRLCSFLSSRPFQYLKLLSKCCIRLGRSAKAGEKKKQDQDEA